MVLPALLLYYIASSLCSPFADPWCICILYIVYDNFGLKWNEEASMCNNLVSCCIYTLNGVVLLIHPHFITSHLACIQMLGSQTHWKHKLILTAVSVRSNPVEEKQFKGGLRLFPDWAGHHLCQTFLQSQQTWNAPQNLLLDPTAQTDTAGSPFCLHAAFLEWKLWTIPRHPQHKQCIRTKQACIGSRRQASTWEKQIGACNGNLRELRMSGMGRAWKLELSCRQLPSPILHKLFACQPESKGRSHGLINLWRPIPHDPIFYALLSSINYYQ